ERQAVAAGSADEQPPVGPLRTRVVVFEVEADACRAASLDGGVDVGDADLPGEHAWRVVVSGGFLDAEMHGVGSEADAVPVIPAPVDDRQAEFLVEGALGGEVAHV